MGLTTDHANTFFGLTLTCKSKYNTSVLRPTNTPQSVLDIITKESFNCYCIMPVTCQLILNSGFV